MADVNHSGGFDHVEYLQGKLLLKPNPLSSLERFHDFGKLIKGAAKSLGVGFVEDRQADEAPTVREVVFGDTADFRLLHSGFILRRRIPYVDGFPSDEPEIVFKFRGPDRQRAAALDVRPAIPGKFRVKFKAQILPLHERLGGYRLLYSHNCQFGISQVPVGDRRAVSFIARTFPVLESLKTSKEERIEFVNEGIVEELLLPIGTLDFGKGVTAKSDIALWRTRGEHLALVGEYSFQAKFDQRDAMPPKPKRRIEEFFVGLQREFRTWIALGTTKTALVYGLNGHRGGRG
jgi:hypothetical protein